MEKLIFIEKYAPYPPRKATKSPCSRKEEFDATQKKQIDPRHAQTG
jgi:hypothetical protein